MLDVPGAGIWRALPSVQRVLELLEPEQRLFPHPLIVRETREVINAERKNIVNGHAAREPEEIAVLVQERLRRIAEPSLRPVINATGVILHTNLGRAPLGVWQPHPGYSNLEYSLDTGKRGRRDSHLTQLFHHLLARPAIAVNNGAAATFLALNEFAAGFEVIVSRGELIEIGDGFRIPEILTRSGAILREVGTTNRTRIEDYREAISDRTRLLLRVHPSNFHIEGFTSKPRLGELVALGRDRGIPVYEDLGSGNLLDLRPFGIAEPRVSDSLDAGVNLVSFSGDKLLGGPQAGILAGNPELVERIRRNPLFRALRLDKLVSQSLENTLRNLVLERWDALPALRMIRITAAEIERRAAALVPRFERIPGYSIIGGGSTPNQAIPTTLIVAASAGASAAEQWLRTRNTPIITRIEQDRVLVDLRTVFPSEETALKEALEELQARS